MSTLEWAASGVYLFTLEARPRYRCACARLDPVGAEGGVGDELLASVAGLMLYTRLQGVEGVDLGGERAHEHHVRFAQRGRPHREVLSVTRTLAGRTAA